jgi:hypothetical protein
MGNVTVTRSFVFSGYRNMGGYTDGGMERFSRLVFSSSAILGIYPPFSLLTRCCLALWEEVGCPALMLFFPKASLL